MKTYIKYVVVFALIISPILAFGKSLMPEIKPYEFKASIQTEDSKNIKIYRYDDVEKKNTCYVAYMNGFTNGMSLGLSCVK